MKVGRRQIAQWSLPVDAPREYRSRAVHEQALVKRDESWEQRGNASGLAVLCVGDHQTVGLPRQVAPPEPVVVWHEELVSSRVDDKPDASAKVKKHASEWSQ